MIDSDKSLSLNYANISVRNVLLFYPVYLKSSTVTFGAPLRVLFFNPVYLKSSTVTLLLPTQY